MDENLITTLIKQHRTLQKLCGEILVLSQEVSESQSVTIQSKLDLFKQELTAHLSLENKQFYTKLVTTMTDKGMHLDKANAFIAEMKEIEKTVLSFLNKYNKPESILGQAHTFKQEFAQIAEALTLRIESEEAGIYSYWLSF